MADDDRTPSAIRRTQIFELKTEIKRVEARIEDAEDGLGVVRDQVSDLRETTARIDGQMQHLSAAYERAAQVVAVQAQADADVRRAQGLAEVRERERGARLRRNIQKELAFKIITVAMGLATALTAIVGHMKC
jgi:septal ring factor EnvC (AmiA/AmiB activator)